MSIVPIEFPLPPLAENELELRKEGTQELIVTTADRGAWPKVSDLEVSPVPCVDIQEGKPAVADPKDCIGMISKFTTAKTVFWVPLSGPRTELDLTKKADVWPHTIPNNGVIRRPAVDPGSVA
ncbi:MAG: hypothetical protein ACKV2T_20025 [Kofleriaceae bacterium]